MTRAAILIALTLSAAYAVGQEATSPKSDTANSVDTAYSNECLALSYRLPDGWKFAKVAQAKTDHQSSQQMTLFRAQRDSAAASTGSLELDLLEPRLQHPNMERFTILLALSFVRGSAKNEITRNAYPVTIAGRSFYRSDLRSGDKSVALLSTWYRGYAVVAWVFANSPQALEGAAGALNAPSFGEDKRTADCFDSAN